MLRNILTVLMILFTFSFTSAQQRGKASWYGNSTHHGKKAADGSVFNQYAMTCASNTHRLGTILRITNVENNKSITAKVTDRGGFSKMGRLLDLSKGAFQAIASLKQGIITVLVEEVN